ncbi:A20 [Mytilus edulis]|uniref:ubiquitinyl hydrolase 1 n=1 Tax=Mytilus edulis TaxID=6550 RepID=A0A8S3QUA0_MYTED|nr:A20 [Mytilus edulis]
MIAVGNFHLKSPSIYYTQSRNRNSARIPCLLAEQLNKIDMSDVVPPFKKNFRDCSPHMANSLQESIQNDIDTSERNKTFCLKSYHVYNINLPNLTLYPEGFRHFYLLNILDTDIRQELQDNKVINWCRSAKTLYPLKTKGDGNCLLHAVSMCLWGLEDESLLLRRLLYVSLVQDSSTQKNFQRRWLLRQRRMNQERPFGFNAQLDKNEWEREWETITNAAIDQQNREAFLPYDTLEAVHLYVLANILRRPIIVLASKNVRSVYGNSVQECNISGIYLPLEWKENEIYPSPILIGYSMNHFVPLVTKQSLGRDNEGELVVPLVLSDQTPLFVQFLLPEEEPLVQDLLKMYLKLKSVPMTTQDSVLQIPVAKLEFQTIQDHHNLVQDHLSECLQIYGFWSKDPSRTPQAQEPPVFVNNEYRVVDQEKGTITCQPKCWNEGCEMYGALSIAGYCHKCFMDYTRDYKRNEDVAAQNRQIEMEPTAPPASFTTQQVYEMSMMEEQCKNKCGNRASTKTQPYCHECHPSESRRHPPPNSNTPLSLHETLSKGQSEPIDDQSLFGTGQSRTPPGSGHQMNRQSPGFRFTDFSPSHENSPPNSRPAEAAGGRSGPSSQTYLLNDLNDLSGARNPPNLRSFNPEDLQCKTLNCKNPPHFFLEGYCNECANSRNRKTETYSVRTSDRTQDKVMQTSFVPTTAEGKNICLTPGCYGPIEQGGLCHSCIVNSRRSSDPTEYGAEQLIESATPCQHIAPDEVNPVITSHKDKVKCASPVCENMIYPPNQMCETCTSILAGAHARCRSTEHKRLSPDKKDKMKPLPIRQIRKGTICIEPGCDKYGDESMYYRCTFHYNVLKEMYGGSAGPPSRTGPGTINTSVPTSVSRTAPVTSNIPRPGMNLNATIPGATSPTRTYPMLPAQVEQYNVPEREPMNDLSRTTVTSPGVEQKYSLAMSKVERERRSIKFCKGLGCNNYGNTSKEGYCNSCYPEIQRQRLTGNGGKPEYKDHYCC